jgi:hypothetical protein
MIQHKASLNSRSMLYGIMQKKSSTIFDIVIVAHSKDKDTLLLLLESIQKYIHNYRNIYLIAKENFIGDKVIFIEEGFFPFKKTNISEILLPMHCPEYKHGWFYQQLLKLYSYKIIKDLTEHFLILDADLIFINKISFFDGNTPFFTTGYSHNQYYFDHMNKFIPGLTKQTEFSGISHHMIFKKEILEDLFNKVELIHKIPFWRSFLNCVSFERVTHYSCASEYEIYFNYVLKFYSSFYKIRQLKWNDIHGDDINKKRHGHIFLSHHDYNINNFKLYQIE